VLLALAAHPAVPQQKKTLAVVVKGLDNPFFTVLGNGCEKWNKENAKSEYNCLYTGPASSADEAGDVRIVEDLINSGVAGIAISPSNAPAMANVLKAKKPTMPIMTIDADLAEADRSLRRTYLGTNNYDMGVLMAPASPRSSRSAGPT
jgi:ribose transport system substrate-binding protein